MEPQPPAFGLGTKTTTAEGEQRKKATQACDMCRAKRTKCDGDTPKCGKCRERDSDCLYTTVQRRRGPPKGYVFTKESDSPPPTTATTKKRKQASLEVESPPSKRSQSPWSGSSAQDNNKLSQLSSLASFPMQQPVSSLYQNVYPRPNVVPVYQPYYSPLVQSPGYTPPSQMYQMSPHIQPAQHIQQIAHIPQMQQMQMQMPIQQVPIQELPMGQFPMQMSQIPHQIPQQLPQMMPMPQMMGMQQQMVMVPHMENNPYMLPMSPMSPISHYQIHDTPRHSTPQEAPVAPVKVNAEGENSAISALLSLSPAASAENLENVDKQSEKNSDHQSVSSQPSSFHIPNLDKMLDHARNHSASLGSESLHLNQNVVQNILSGQTLFAHLAGMAWPVPGAPREVQPSIPYSMPDPDDLPPLPDADTINQIIQLFFTHVNPRYGLLVEQRTFLVRLTGAEGGDEFDQRLLKKPVNPLLLSAMLALGGTFLPVSQPRRVTKTLFARAKKLLPHYLSSLKPEDLDVESLMAIFLLGVFSAYAFAIALPGYQLGFLAILLSRRQQAHYARHPEMIAEETWIEQEQRRRLWLLLFIYDHRSAVTTDHPPYFTAEQMSKMGVYLPVSDVVWTDPELKLNLIGPHLPLVTFGTLVDCVKNRDLTPRQVVERLSEVSNHVWKAGCPIIMGDIVECHLRARKANMDPFDGDNVYSQELTSLTSLARRWRPCIPCATPSGADDVLTSTLIQHGTDLDDLWNAINYHVTCIQANIPREFAGLNPQHLANHPTWGQHPMAKVAGAHAIAVAQLLDKVMTVDPLLEYADPFCQFVAISVGILHFLRIKSLQQQLEEIAPTTRKMRPTQEMVVNMASAAKDIDTCIRFLHILGRKYRLSAQMGIFLNQLSKLAAILPVWTPTGLIVVDEGGVRIDTWDQAVGEEGSMQELPDIVDALGTGPPDEIPIHIPRRPPLLRGIQMAVKELEQSTGVPLLTTPVEVAAPQMKSEH